MAILKTIKYFDTFTGVGGFTLGIERAAEAMGKKAKCVGYSEIDKYASQVYQQHYRVHRNFGDITKIDEATIPPFQLFVGGFPCQPFSHAGKRRGFKDTRGTLFFDIARILKAKRPRAVILENVDGLLSHDDGNTFRTVIATLAELGYVGEWQVLNSKNHGVPQSRKRVYIIGYLGAQSGSQVFPIGSPGEIHPRSNEAQKEVRDHSQTITTQSHKNGTGTHIALTMTARQYRSWNGNFVEVGTLRTHKDGQGFRKVKSGLSPTIPARAREDGSGQPIIKVKERHRRFTPIECERLQGFPDGWTEKGFDGEEEILISDTQRYKMMGNAVSVPVVEYIIKRLIENKAL